MCGVRERDRDAGGVDLQILGIGTDGHIAFNEPVLAGLPDPDQDADRQTRIDNGPLPSRRRRIGAHALPDQGLATIMELGT